MLAPADLAAILPPPDRLVLFLDVDGTLIGAHHSDRELGLLPEQHDRLDRLRRLLEDRVVVLTGRSIEKIDQMFAPAVMPIAGLQGVDRRYPDGRRVMPVLEPAARRALEDVVDAVIAAGHAVEVEWKPAAIALVYDEGDPVSGPVFELAKARAGDRFKVMRGRVAVDVVPPEADKGVALRAFMAEPGFAGRVPVHFGDDVPDEPAFVAAQQFGGFGVAVDRQSVHTDRRILDHSATWAVIAAYLDRHGAA